MASGGDVRREAAARPPAPWVRSETMRTPRTHSAVHALACLFLLTAAVADNAVLATKDFISKIFFIVYITTYDFTKLRTNRCRF